jgi:hypothetical protein
MATNTMTNEDSKAWAAIARIDRTMEMPDDPTLRRAAVWWEVFSGLPDEPASRMWASYVADAWEHSDAALGELARKAEWLDVPAEKVREQAADAKVHYDAVTSEWWGTSGAWSELETEKTRRLVRFVIATQKRLVALMVEQGEISAGRVRERLVDPYVAGYLSGLATNWCDASGIDVGDERCRSEMLEMFREMFGTDADEVAATLFFERWSGEVECVDGMLHAHEGGNSFRRRERGIRVNPRVRLFEHLTR